MLTPGARLGPYEVIGPIGAGGMGEVYRGRDTRLRRDVAIKVLPPAVSADPTRRKRFEVEARAIAALSHPHICPIYDVGAEGELQYLVLELVQGETLAARLKRGPMPLAEALARAVEMADAMATAHRRGIIHRDLKPGNVMLTKAGAVILDFGLARIVRDDPATFDAAQTATAPLTEAGLVLGTLQYMAPEQIENRPTDARTDVFAFGAVFFEMLTSRKAFDGSSAPAVMGAILRADAPSAVAVQPALPSSVDRVIRTCLAKDPADRLASMQDVKVALGWIQEDVSRLASDSPAAKATRGRSRGPLVAGAIAAAAIAGIAGYLYGRRSSPAAPHPSSYVYNIPLPPTQRFWEGSELSRDGRRLAVVTSGSPAGPRLWIRDLDSVREWQLVSGAGDEVPHYPIWSPDGLSLAFFSRGHLVRVDLPSLVPIEICQAADGHGGVWLDDNTIVFAPGPETGLMRVDVRTGRQEEFIALAPDEQGLKYPSLAGNRRIIYWANTKKGADSEVRLVSLDNPKYPLTVIKSLAGAVYDLGTLFYLRSGLWVGQSFNVETNKFSGEPKPVAVDGPWLGNIGAPAVSAQSGHVAAKSAGLPVVQPLWMDRTGKVLSALGAPDKYESPDISVDGRVAVSKIGQNESDQDIWTLDPETAAPRRITTAIRGAIPVWSHDGRRIAFQSMSGVAGAANVYEVDAVGIGRPRPVVEGNANLSPVGWLADARFVFTNVAPSTPGLPNGILIHEPDRERPTLYRTGGDAHAARLSPDAKRIVFAEYGPGSSDLFVDRVPQPGAQPVLVWHGAVRTPRWSADGREVFFVRDGHLMSAAISDGPVLKATTPVKLFDVPSASFAVDPTTGRFLVMRPVSTPVPSVTVTLNWPR